MEFEKRREFLLREKLVSLRDKVWIMNPEEQNIGHFIGKIFTIRALYRLKDLEEKTKLVIRQKLASVRPMFRIFEPGDDDEPDENKYLGNIKRKLVSIKPKYWFEDPNENRIFDIKGNVWGLKYTIIKEGKEIARISQKLWRIRGTFGLKINSDISDQLAMIILCTVMILQHERKKEQQRRQHRRQQQHIA